MTDRVRKMFILPGQNPAMKVQYIDDGPRPDWDFEPGDWVEMRSKGGLCSGRVIDVGTIEKPTAEESALPHDPSDWFVRWSNPDRREWTCWTKVCPRF